MLAKKTEYSFEMSKYLRRMNEFLRTIRIIREDWSMARQKLAKLQAYYRILANIQALQVAIE